MAARTASHGFTTGADPKSGDLRQRAPDSKSNGQLAYKQQDTEEKSKQKKVSGCGVEIALISSAGAWPKEILTKSPANNSGSIRRVGVGDSANHIHSACLVHTHVEDWTVAYCDLG